MKKIVLIITTLSLISFSCLPATTSTSMSLVDRLEDFIDGYSDLNEAQKEALKASSIQGSLVVKSLSSSSDVNLNSSNSTTTNLSSLDEFYSIKINSNLDSSLEVTIKFISSSGQVLLEGKKDINLKEKEAETKTEEAAEEEENIDKKDSLEFDSSNPFIVEETEFFSNLEDKKDSSSTSATGSSKECPPNFSKVTTAFFNYCKGSDENKFLKFNAKAKCHDKNNKDTTGTVDLTLSTITQTAKCSGISCQPVELDQLSTLSPLMTKIDINLKTEDSTEIFCGVGTSSQDLSDPNGFGSGFGF